MKSFDSTGGLIGRRHEEIPLNSEDLIGMIEAALAKSATFQFRAKGFSMWPFIKDADIVTIISPRAGRFRLGDVAAFVQPESKTLVLHRIIAKQGGAFLMKGDNTLTEDGIVSQAHILGRVQRVERNGKRVSLGLGPERMLIAGLIRSRLFCALGLLKSFARTK